MLRPLWHFLALGLILNALPSIEEASYASSKPGNESPQHDELHRDCVQFLSSPSVCRGIELRRTASWGSRDAFTDGHLTHHADASSTHTKGKRSRTAKAHAFRKFHPAYRPNAAEARAPAVSFFRISVGPCKAAFRLVAQRVVFGRFFRSVLLAASLTRALPASFRCFQKLPDAAILTLTIKACAGARHSGAQLAAAERRGGGTAT